MGNKILRTQSSDDMERGDIEEGACGTSTDCLPHLLLLPVNTVDEIVHYPLSGLLVVPYEFMTSCFITCRYILFCDS